MSDLPKTIKISELPEVSNINDTDIFIVEDGSTTNKITGKNLISYIKNHGDINDYYILQSSMSVANGVATLDANAKIPSENINFGTTSGTVFDGVRGKALEDGLDAHLLDSVSHITSNERTNWDTAYTNTHAHINKSILDNTTASFTEELLTKLNGIATNANAYTHPSYTEQSSGLYKVTVDSTGHVSSTTSVTKDDIISILGYTPGTSTTDTNTTYTLTKSGTTITLTGSDGTTTSVTDTDTNTLNTAGSSNTSSKIFLVGTTSQTTSATTYSHDTVYVGTDGHLYSNDIQVVNLSSSQALTNKTYNGYTLAAACAKAVTDSSSASAISTGTSLVTERDVYYGLPTINNSHAYTSSTTIYAPTVGGTSGYILTGNGITSAPIWSSAISASKVSTGTFASTGVVAATGTDYTTNRIRNIVFTTTDPGASASTTYANGSIICVYE